MSKRFLTVQADFGDTLKAQLLDASKLPFPLEDYDVKLQLCKADETELWLRTASVLDAAQGVVAYTWRSGDFPQSGYYLARFIVTFGTDLHVSFPRPDWISVEVGAPI